MKRSGLWILLCLMFCVIVGAAAEGTEYLVFRSAGLRYRIQEDERVLTAANLNRYEDFLSQLGTDAETVAAYYAESGIVMDVYPDNGGQISVAVTDATALTEVAEISQFSEEGRIAFVDRFSESGLYDSAEWSDKEENWLRLTSVATYGSLPVQQIRYMTLHLSRLYTVTGTVVGREAEAEDEEKILRVLRNLILLNTISTPTPEPTPEPTLPREAEPTPEPPPAVMRSLSGNLTLEEFPSIVNREGIMLSGTASVGAVVTVSEEGAALGTTAAGEDGSFTLHVPVSEEGEHTLLVSAGEAETEVTFRYELPPAKLTITEPASPVFTGERILIRGVTEPNATIYATGEKTSANVKANKNGVFTVPIFMNQPGTNTYTLRVRIRGKSETTREVTLTRVMTEREEFADFKGRQVAVSYRELAENPASYSGKNFSFRGKVMDFIDFDGSPTALVCVTNQRTGVWQDPLYVVLSVGDGVKEGEVYTFYLVGEGLTLPAEGQYTADGKAAEAPVATVFRYTTGR
ncbi:MAG: hypothetical protein K5746_10225 [Clostridiales bacterium]|nr:hypothetical protein [Clostridiales bacterium]